MWAKALARCKQLLSLLHPPCLVTMPVWNWAYWVAWSWLYWAERSDVSLETAPLHGTFVMFTIIWQSDKTNKMAVRPAKTQISLGIRPVWSESLLSAWRQLGSLATHWAHSEDSDQTGRMPRLIWVVAGCTVILLVLSWGGSFLCQQPGGQQSSSFTERRASCSITN